MNVDTLAIARDLRATDLPVAQAEAIAAAIGRSMSEGVASKSDIDVIVQKIDALGARMEASERSINAKVDSFERSFEAKIEALGAKLTSKIDNAQSSILVWLMGVILATAGVVIAVLKYQ